MMPNPLPKCPRCGGEMQQGYIADRAAGGYDPAKWFEGDLVTGFLGGIEKPESKPLLVRHVPLRPVWLSGVLRGQAGRERREEASRG